MAGSMTGLFVTVACLNDEEWDAAASMMGMRPEERERMQCLLDQLGGPGEMAEATKAAGEGDFTDLARSGADCGLDTGLDMGPAPGQTSVTPLAAPTAIGEAPTVVSTPVPVTARPHRSRQGGAHDHDHDHDHPGDHRRPHPGGHPRI